jgi:hypothetical protein
MGPSPPAPQSFFPPGFSVPEWRKVRRLIQWVFLEGLATGEASLETVPEEDLRLAKAPAQEHLLSPSPGQEIHQPAIQILVQG